MSALRFYTLAVFRDPLPFRQGPLARTIIGYKFASRKAKPAEVAVPKRPPNAYVMFVSEERPIAAQQYPASVTPREIMKILSARWNGMSDDEKRPYKDAYTEKMNIYYAPLAKLPKKPPGVFGLFVKEKYSSVEAQNPGSKISDIMIELSREWQSLPDAEKGEWVQKREALKQEYKEKVMNFGKGLSPEERAFLEEKQSVQLRKLKKEQRQLLGYPKRPLSAFIIFSQRNIEGLEGLPLPERTKILGKTWREMDEAKKEEYFEKSREAREKYEKDVAEWMQNNPDTL